MQTPPNNTLASSYGPLWVIASCSSCLFHWPDHYPWRSVFAWFALVPCCGMVDSAASAHRTRAPQLSARLHLWRIVVPRQLLLIRDVMTSTATCRPLRPRCCSSASVSCLAFTLRSSDLQLLLCRRPRKYALVARRSTRLLVALELAAARITSVPGPAWLFAGGQRARQPARPSPASTASLSSCSSTRSSRRTSLSSLSPSANRVRCRRGARSGRIREFVPQAPSARTTALAVLIQPNLDVSGQSLWSAPASGSSSS